MKDHAPGQRAGQRNRRRWLLIVLTFWVSLVLLRTQLVFDMQLDFKTALATGFKHAWVYDLSLSLFPAALALAAGAIGLPLRMAGILFTTLGWIANLGNVLYFRFFNTPLELWVVQFQWKDFFQVADSAGSLSVQWLIIGSAIAFLASCSLWLRLRIKRTHFRDRIRTFALGGGLLALALMLKQSPTWFGAAMIGAQHKGTVLNSQVMFRWWLDANAENLNSFTSVNLSDLHSRADARKFAPRTLAAYRDFTGGNSEDSLAGTQLVRDLPQDPELSRKLRRLFGFSETKPVSVIFLFVESLRAFEFLDPEIGPAVLPRLRDIAHRKGVLFEQTYSSSLAGGQTVRGQFSTQCSMLPDSKGPATYIAFPTVRIECIASVLKAQGYQTTWLNSYFTHFHGKGLFESLHGIQQFYDQDYFLGQGVAQRIGNWGLADLPFLQVTLKTLESVHSRGPFYANVLTISTHHPYSVIPEGPLPKWLADATAKAPDYQGYLSRVRYADEALGAFWDAFEKSPIADDTLVVIMGDHTTHVPTHMPMSRIRSAELQYRIPLMFLSKNAKLVKRFKTPVHQVDIAPTVAAILGIHGKTAWLGHNVMPSDLKTPPVPGSPLVYGNGYLTSYRYGNHVCHSSELNPRLTCVDLRDDEDLMFSTTAKAVKERPEWTSFFKKVVQSNSEVILYDLIMDNNRP